LGLAAPFGYYGWGGPYGYSSWDLPYGYSDWDYSYSYPASYSGYYGDDCYMARREVQTVYGWRWRRVEICQ
jgi:hypothetical protein